MHYYKENITQNLKDAGCDKTIIEAFLCNLQAGNQMKATQLLQNHRHNLLGELHKYQKQIDYLDYLVFMLQKSKSNNI